MSITINLPPQMAQEAQGYVALEGTSIEQAFLKWLAGELRHNRRKAMASSEDNPGLAAFNRIDAIVSNHPPRSFDSDMEIAAELERKYESLH